jgi:hypothetical protein
MTYRKTAHQHWTDHSRRATEHLRRPSQGTTRAATAQAESVYDVDLVEAARNSGQVDALYEFAESFLKKK